MRRSALLAALCVAATAGAASAATLHIAVPRHNVKKGHDFTIRVTGTYKQAELQGSAFLVAAFQYDSKPCKATGTEEFALTDTYFFFSGKVKHTPFAKVSRWSARTPGPRRLCAYLYPKKVGPSTTVAPIATASGFFRVVR